MSENLSSAAVVIGALRVNVTKCRRVEVVGALRDLSNLKITGHALPTKVTNVRYRTCRIVSAGRYINVRHTLQMKTTCYMRKVSIKLANCS